MSFLSNGRELERIKAAHPVLRGATPGLVRRDPGDASIGTGEFTQGVPAFWFARSTEYGSAENLYTPYADSPWVRRAIQIIAQPISSCELLFTRPTTVKVRSKRTGLKQLSTSRGIVYRDQSELLDLPQLQAWLKEPVRDLTWADFVEGSIGWLKMQECFWLYDAVKLPFPKVAENPYSPVRFARPDRMRPTIDDGEITGWTFTSPDGKTVKLDPDQVVRLRGWNPYDDYKGLGDYRSAHIAAEADWLASKFSRNLMANNGDTSRVIVVKGGQPSDLQRTQLLREFKARREASLRGENRDVVVGGDVEMKNAELAAVDASFVAQRIENRHEIFGAFGVPMSMADIKASYSIGSASDQFFLIINTCIPTGGKLCGALEKLIYRMTGERVEVGLNWDEHPCMQEVRKERLDTVAKLTAQGMPMEAVNEYLALGLVKYPGWEVGYIPINLQPVLNQDGEVTLPPGPSDANEPLDESGAPTGNGEKPISDGSDTPADGDNPEVKAMVEALRRGKATVARAASTKLWENHMRLRGAAIKQYQSKASKVFNEYRAKTLKRLAAVKSFAGIERRSLVDIIFAKEQFSLDLTKSLDPIKAAVMQRAGEECLEEIGRQDDPWKIAPSAVKSFQAQRNKLLARVGDTVNSQINTALAEGLDQGETTDELAARVKGVFNNLTNFEARRIATTETSADYGFSRHLAMSDAGIEYKAWLTSGGDNVREAHAQAGEDYDPDGGGIPIDQAFIVDGEELQYPGDDAGSASNVINCHCIQIAVQAPAGKED